MQDRKLFEYAILRAVPRVEREEFVNIGVVMKYWRPVSSNTSAPSATISSSNSHA
jgi:hypothetical protein